MAGQLVQHVVEEADAGPVVVRARAVEVDLDRDVGFRRGSRDRGLAHGPSPVADRGAYREGAGACKGRPLGPRRGVASRSGRRGRAPFAASPLCTRCGDATAPRRAAASAM